MKLISCARAINLCLIVLEIYNFDFNRLTQEQNEYEERFVAITELHSKIGLINTLCENYPRVSKILLLRKFK